MSVDLWIKDGVNLFQLCLLYGTGIIQTSPKCRSNLEEKEERSNPAKKWAHSVQRRYQALPRFPGAAADELRALDFRALLRLRVRSPVLVFQEAGAVTLLTFALFEAYQSRCWAFALPSRTWPGRPLSRKTATAFAHPTGYQSTFTWSGLRKVRSTPLRFLTFQTIGIQGQGGTANCHTPS